MAVYLIGKCRRCSALICSGKLYMLLLIPKFLHASLPLDLGSKKSSDLSTFSFSKWSATLQLSCNIPHGTGNAYNFIGQ